MQCHDDMETAMSWRITYSEDGLMRRRTVVAPSRDAAIRVIKDTAWLAGAVASVLKIERVK